MALTRHRIVVVAAALALAAGACSGGGSSDSAKADKADATTTTEALKLPAGWEGYRNKVYADDAHWMCKPGMADDVCSRDLDATEVAADGTTKVVKHEAAKDPKVDCFYVYPTTSGDPGVNSDLTPAPNQEIATVYNQVARLNSVCRIYAPVYRQITLKGLTGGFRRGGGGANAGAIAYGDVLDAFKQYMANDNHGRGFILVGHSQGSGMLTQLIAREIDGQPDLRSHLVAAYLLGGGVSVPDGKVVGGSFKHVPLCQKADETGCVVAYSSFRSTVPPPPDSLFGRSRDGGHTACVNPADLTGEPAQLHPYFLVKQVDGTLLGGASVTPFADKARDSTITTPWVTYPDFVEGQCVSKGGFTYLSLKVEASKSDARTDNIPGDLSSQWGMHLIDANIAMGDLETLAASQAEAYAG
jgi:Protein of unknown function (DUF3089)